MPVLDLQNEHKISNFDKRGNMTEKKGPGRPSIGDKALSAKDRSERYRIKLAREGSVIGTFKIDEVSAAKKFKQIQKKMGMTKKATAEYLIYKSLQDVPN